MEDEGMVRKETETPDEDVEGHRMKSDRHAPPKSDDEQGDEPDVEAHRHSADRNSADRHSADRHSADRHSADRHSTD